MRCGQSKIEEESVARCKGQKVSMEEKILGTRQGLPMAAPVLSDPLPPAPPSPHIYADIKKNQQNHHRDDETPAAMENKFADRKANQMERSLLASESGDEVSKMLEANPLHYHSNFADNKVAHAPPLAPVQPSGGGSRQLSSRILSDNRAQLQWTRQPPEGFTMKSPDAESHTFHSTTCTLDCESPFAQKTVVDTPPPAAVQTSGGVSRRISSSILSAFKKFLQQTFRRIQKGVLKKSSSGFEEEQHCASKVAHAPPSSVQPSGGWFMWLRGIGSIFRGKAHTAVRPWAVEHDRVPAESPAAQSDILYLKNKDGNDFRGIQVDDRWQDPIRNYGNDLIKSPFSDVPYNCYRGGTGHMALTQ